MAHNYGLGRGLASLIPRKRKTDEGSGKSASLADEKITEYRKELNYCGSNFNVPNQPVHSENNSKFSV